jgi:hypothetical protein
MARRASRTKTEDSPSRKVENDMTEKYHLLIDQLSTTYHIESGCNNLAETKMGEKQ